ncbi:MAG: RelA/SpoT family protein [Flavobacteriaceae bacterium]
MAYHLSTEEENKEIARRYKDLLKGTYQILSKEDKTLIRSAFELALDAHSTQRRKSGEPYIFHPIAVAKIVAYEIGLGAISIASALLHDVVEDTDYSHEDIEAKFGARVSLIVKGLTKISRLSKEQDESIQAENFRKMLLTLNEDVRVILIKIADRLHNMQTMDSMPAHKQLKISSETLYIYAPLAHRLGLYNIKTELEDLGLKYTEPNVYEDISNKIADSKEVQNQYIENFKAKISNTMDQEGFDYIIKGRSKSIYSIRRKILKQGVSFDEVYDKFAIRIIYKSSEREEKFDAWKIYSIVTDHYKPNPSRLRDWISQPKSTGYEALHTTVMGPGGNWVEVQVRSEKMDEIAEKGYAAHFKYKQGNQDENGLEDWLNKLKETLEDPKGNAVDFVKNFKLNLYSKEIFVFTPNGEIKALPKGASSLDFAFAIHTDVGLKCRGAKVNGKLVPIDHKLNSGDQVEIITASNKKPNARWLDFVITSRARTRIKNALKEDEKLIAEEGKQILIRKLRHLKIDMNEKVINELCHYFNLKTSFDLFFRVGTGRIENKNLKDFASQRSNALVKFFKNRIKRAPAENIQEAEEVTYQYDTLVFGNDEQTLDFSFAQCCKPIPGDSVFGFTTVSDGIKVHRNDCPNAISLQSNYAYRIIKATWVDSSQKEFKVGLKITGLDNVGIVNNLTKVISSNMNVNIHNIHFEGVKGLFQGELTVSVKNTQQLNRLIQQIEKIEGVKSVKRFTK